MTPDPAMFASASTSRAAAPSNRRHKSSHHRGKTAKSKKKKLWSHFSPWDASKGSDGEDDDLVYFCRSRGISKSPAAVATTTAPTAARAQTTNQPNNGYRQRRPTIALPISAFNKPKIILDNSGNAKSEILAPESRVTASLCASLKDKGKFVRESRGQPTEIPNDDAKSRQDMSEKNQDVKKVKETQPSVLNHNDADAESTTTTEENSSQHSSSSFPRLNSNANDEQDINARVKFPTSPSRSSGDFHRQGASRKPVREWSADVETEIMRLYESSGPGSGLSVLEAKSGAKAGLRMKDQVESKLNNSDHTPSYVLALANLFRRRMQIRKEFSQVSGEMVDNNLKPSLAGPYSITNAFPAPKNSPRPCPHTSIEEDNSPVSLRYHHVTTLSGTNAIKTLPQASVAKPSSVTFCSFASPLTTGVPTTATHKVDKATEPVLQPVESQHELTADATAAPVVTKAQSSEMLETLLTVFPKPPQLKFATVAEGSATKRHVSSTKETQTTANEAPQKEKNDSSTTSLIMSVAATRKKEPKITLPSKSNGEIGLEPKHTRRRSEHKPLKPLGVARKCRSAELKHQESSEHFQPQRCFDVPELPPRKKVRDFFLFDKSMNIQGNEDSATLTPVTKVRWSGSLGTLYPKPKILGDTVRCAAQADAISPRLMVNRLMSICDVTLTRTGNGKGKIANDCQPKTELMTVSPIDKHKSTVAS